MFKWPVFGKIMQIYPFKGRVLVKMMQIHRFKGPCFINDANYPVLMDRFGKMTQIHAF